MSRHHGLRTATQVRLIQPTLNPTLAVRQFLSYDLVHSKSLRASGVRVTRYLMKHRKSRGISFFTQISSAEGRRLRLLKEHLGRIDLPLTRSCSQLRLT